MTQDKTVYVIFHSVRDFPHNPVYEGDDISQAAKKVIEGADAGKNVAIRVRWKGKLIYGLAHEAHALANEVREQRRMQPKEQPRWGYPV